jgi:transcriptional regulator with XRE-family HTH domain
VFEIGSSLREARTRRGLTLPDVERATHIRPRYLTAMEEDRFDTLPSPAYAKGFLRTYAEFLGLEGQRFVDEYNVRFPPTEETAATPPQLVRRRRPLANRVLVAVPIAGILIGLIVWQLTTTREAGHNLAPSLPQTHTTRTAAPASPAQPVKHVAAIARLMIVATRGPCWLGVRIGSEAGPSAYARTLDQGMSARFVSKRLWIRIGAPWNVDATLNGRALGLPATTGNVVVTSTGLARIG